MSICRATILVSWGKPHGWKLWSCTDSSSLKPLSLTLPLLCWNCLEKSFFYRPPFTLWLHISSTRLFPRQVNAKLFFGNNPKSLSSLLHLWLQSLHITRISCYSLLCKNLNQEWMWSKHLHWFWSGCREWLCDD